MPGHGSLIASCHYTVCNSIFRHRDKPPREGSPVIPADLSAETRPTAQVSGWEEPTGVGGRQDPLERKQPVQKWRKGRRSDSPSQEAVAVVK